MVCIPKALIIIKSHRRALRRVSLKFQLMLREFVYKGMSHVYTDRLIILYRCKIHDEGWLVIIPSFFCVYDLEFRVRRVDAPIVIPSQKVDDAVQDILRVMV